MKHTLWNCIAARTLGRAIFLCALLGFLVVIWARPALAQVVTFTVNSAIDAPDAVLDGICANAAGDCTLRAAIQEANNTPARDVIEFDSTILSVDVTLTATATAALPPITQPVLIDGNAGGQVRVRINGSALVGPGLGGVVVNASAVGNNVQLSFLSVVNFPGDGVVLSGTGVAGVQVNGCNLGLDVAGTVDEGNAGNGLVIRGGANNNLIGGTAVDDINFFSGNGGNGVLITGNGTNNNTLDRNAMGLDRDPATVFLVPNDGHGILISSSANNNRIGSAFGNFSSGNALSGLSIQGNSTAGNVVRLSTFGLDLAANAPLPNGEHGIELTLAATNNFIGDATGQNVIASNTQSGISISSGNTDNNEIKNNRIGTDATGTLDLGNTLDGVSIELAARNNIIGTDLDGTDDALEGNLISGNDANGVEISANSALNKVYGNFIGTDANGTATLGNGLAGVYINDGTVSAIGAPGLGRNIIAGNGGAGVEISGNDALANFAQNNYIGTDISSTLDLGNGSHGVLMSGGATNNTVGGSGVGERNVISGNAGDGVRIVDAGSEDNKIFENLIGTDINGTAAVGNDNDGVALAVNANNNFVRGNIISANLGNGVSLTDANTTANVVRGNFIGTDFNGTSDLGNVGAGISLSAGARGNTLGGTAAVDRNLVSGNDSHGILLSGTGTAANNIFSNFIGTDPLGTTAIPNTLDGIRVELGAANNTIGADPGANLISGNGGSGIVIDGTGTNGNTIFNNSIGIEEPGANALPNGLHGVQVLAGAQNNSVDGNLISGNNNAGGAGLNFSGTGTSNNTATGNFLGTETNGNTAVPNETGVLIDNGATSNTIGGSTAATRNIISGNGVNVAILGLGTNNNVVSGNYIGTDQSGTSGISPNSVGVLLDRSSNNTIGGNAVGLRNIISGHSNRTGVEILDADANFVLGNYIGLAPDGVSPVPNNFGITIGGNNNQIGGVALAERNEIAFSSTNGIAVTGVGTGNNFRINSIRSSGALGIDLNADGVTPNDLNDADGGPNGLQNFPEIVLVTGDTASNTGEASGSFPAPAGATYTLDFYISATANASGNGEGEVFVGTDSVAADATGTVNFSSQLSLAPGAGIFVSATATDINGNTSEFGPSVAAITAELTLSLGATTVGEGDGNAATTATVSRNTSTQNALVVTLFSSDTGEATVPATVTIPAGQTSVTFNINAINDNSIDGTQTITLSADATNLTGDSETLDVIDDDVAGISVTPLAGSITTEGGGTDTFSVVLNSQPTANVSVPLSSSDLTEGTLSASTLVFTPANALTPQIVTISGVDDALFDGDQTFSVITAPAQSADADYNNLNPADVSVINRDDEVAVLSLTLSASTLVEGQSTTATVSRTGPNAAALTVNLFSNISSATVPVSVTIAAGQDSISFVVSTLDDALVNGTRSAQITARATGFADVSQTLQIADNDAAGITITPLSGLVTTENGGASTCTLRLNAQPTSNVTIGLSSSDVSEGVLNRNFVLFTPANFATPQTVTVTGVDDSEVDGDQNYQIVTAPAQSLDADFNGLNAANVNVVNRDHDTLALTLAIAPNGFSEGAGTRAAVGTVTRNSRGAAVTIALSSSDRGEATVPANVIIAAGQTQATFVVSAINDAINDGTIAVRIVASSPGYASATQTVSVLDDEGPTLSLLTTQTTLPENAGRVQVTLRASSASPTALNVNLSSSSPLIASVPASVVLPANTRQVTFIVSVVDDALVRGTQTVTLRARAPGFNDGSLGLTVLENDVPTLTLTLSRATINENDGPNAARGVVTRNFNLSLPLTVALSSGDNAKARVPASLTIPANRIQSAFDIAAINDLLATGARNVAISVRGSGLSATAALRVEDDDVVTVQIAPTTLTLTSRETRILRATVRGALDTTVIYTIREGARGGSIDAAGRYTAPATAGVYHVIATSRADRSRSAVAVITVTAAPTPTPTARPTATPIPTATPRPTATPIPTATPRPTARPTPTNAPVPTATPIPTTTPSTIVGAWGDNDYGQIGAGDTSDRANVTAVTVPGEITSLAAGGAHSLAVKRDGGVIAWGLNRNGQLGDGSTIQRPRPVAVRAPNGNGTLGNVTQVAAGWYHSLALKSDGTVWAWGLNRHGQLGTGGRIERNLPTQVRGLTNVRFIASGVEFSAAITRDGSLWTWGRNDRGQLGIGNRISQDLPQRVRNANGEALSGVISVSLGGEHALALRDNGIALAWGANDAGQLGNGQNSTALTAQPIRNVAPNANATVSAPTWRAVAAGFGHSLLLSSDGRVFSCGNNFFGQLGHGDDGNQELPRLVATAGGVNASGRVTSIGAGAGHSVALGSDGILRAWGWNEQGTLGDGTRQNRDLPIVVPGLSGITSFSTGYAHTLALASVRRNLVASASHTATKSAMTFSSGAAVVAGDTIALQFAVPLRADAADNAYFTIEIDNRSVEIESVRTDAAQRRIVLQLAPHTLHAGAQISVAWRDLKLAHGQTQGQCTLLAR